MKKKTIYLHIGLHKTGSTTIQGFLFKNRKLLNKYNISYPIVSHYDNDFSNDERNFVNLRPIWFNKCNYRYGGKRKIFSQSSLQVKNILKTHIKKYYLQQINDSNCQTIILSDEFFSSYGAFRFICKELIDILKEYSFDVKIIAYMRPPIDWIGSLWQQGNKFQANSNINNSKNIIDFFNSKKELVNNYDLTLFIDILGKENVIIRPFEKIQWKNKNLIDDFFAIFNIDLTDEFMIEKKHRNVSLSRNYTEISRLVLSLKLDKYYDIMDKIKAEAPSEPSIVSTLSDEEILEITNEFKPILTKLANIYGKDSFFINEIPSCYGTEREPYKLSITQKQLDILIEAAQKNNPIKAFFRRKIKESLKYILINSLRILSNLGLNLNFNIKTPKCLR